MNDVYLDNEMESWENASDNDCYILSESALSKDWDTYEEDRAWKHFLQPWTFRRVYRIWGLWAALRFLVKGVECIS